MGRRGPPPLPSNVVNLRGNAGRRPLNDAEPKPPPAAPQCPPWLSEDAKHSWQELVELLEPLGLLTVVDGMALAALCEEWATYKAATQFLNGMDETTGKPRGRTYEHTNKFGAVNQVSRPEVAIARNAFLAVKAMCAEFGLTPSARSRIRVDLPKSDPEEYQEHRNRGPSARRS